MSNDPLVAAPEQIPDLAKPAPTSDQELNALGKIIRYLRQMDDGGRARTMAYLNARFGKPDVGDTGIT